MLDIYRKNVYNYNNIGAPTTNNKSEAIIEKVCTYLKDNASKTCKIMQVKLAIR